MTRDTIEAFVELARRDAALQARVAHALDQPNPAHALLAVTQSAGFRFTEADLAASLSSAMSDHALDGVVGGMSSPNEWFAEQYQLLRKPGKVQPD